MLARRVSDFLADSRARTQLRWRPGERRRLEGNQPPPSTTRNALSRQAPEVDNP